MSKATRELEKIRRRQHRDQLTATREPLRAEWIASSLRPILLSLAAIPLALLLAIIVLWHLPTDAWNSQSCSTVKTTHVEQIGHDPKEKITETVESCQGREPSVTTLVALLVAFGLLILPEIATLLPGFSITTPLVSAKTQESKLAPVAKATVENLTSALIAYLTVVDTSPAATDDQQTPPPAP